MGTNDEIKKLFEFQKRDFPFSSLGSGPEEDGSCCCGGVEEFEFMELCIYLSNFLSF